VDVQLFYLTFHPPFANIALGPLNSFRRELQPFIY
jgi:hypothetical protein